jgi:hypothetical protein
MSRQADADRQGAGWVEHGETDVLIRCKAMGFAKAQPILPPHTTTVSLLAARVTPV